jgi:very-short-patch-repair endonuclease
MNADGHDPLETPPADELPPEPAPVAGPAPSDETEPVAGPEPSGETEPAAGLAPAGEPEPAAEPAPEAAEPSLALELDVELEPRIHLAMQHNDVPVIQRLHLRNPGAEPLRGLTLCIEADPPFAAPWTSHLALLPAHEGYITDAVDLALSHQFLHSLTERVAGRLWFEVRQDERVLLRSSRPVEMLACDEWSGLQSLPEILAAFVLPNHPAVEGLLGDARGLLASWSGDPSLAGYQAKEPSRVLQMAAAVYGALQKLDVTYINPPASFEAQGQRIRLPDQLVRSRMATCLDLAVLAAACLEQSGLNPLLVLAQSHAFVGVWLEDECFPEPAHDEPARLRKRVDLGEICVFDPTCVTSRPPIAFDQAVRLARRRLDRPEELHCVIDVLRARKGSIRPLPERIELPAEPAGGASPPAAEATAAPDLTRLPQAPGPAPAAEKPETPATRLDRWRRKLLDLSLRNPLINFRPTKKTIPLLCPDLPALEDALSGGLVFHVRARPSELSPADPRDPEAHRRRTGDDAIEKLLQAGLQARRLHADLDGEGLGRQMIELYRAARLGLEEGGASALYLALGFLAWYETPQSQQQRRAPILLLPLEIQRKSVHEGFRIRLADDEPRVNTTLLEMLAEDHGIRVPGLDPLPEDENGLDVRAVLQTFRQAVRDVARWDVLETSCIGLFSFSKFLMWRDLAERSGELMQSPVVRHLVERTHEGLGTNGFPEPDRLDDERSALETYCPMSADSSQLAAVFAAAEGRSFVLVGPPGTGKSQTITNIVAHCLAEGKSVLFVSEKMAALSVVHDRLARLGLGPWCLELHSNKSQKRDVIARLGQPSTQVEGRAHEDWQREARRLEELRRELNAYARALHQPRRLGRSVFQVTASLIGLRQAPRVTLGYPQPEAIDADRFQALQDLIERARTAGAACGLAPGHAWMAVRQSRWSLGWEAQVRTALERLEASLLELSSAWRAAVQLLTPGSEAGSQRELERLDEAAGVLLESPAPPAALLLRPDWEEIQAQIEAWLEHGRRRDALRAALYARYTPKLLDLDLEALWQRLDQAEAAWKPVGWFRRLRVRKALRSVSKTGRAPARAAPLHADLEQARQLLHEQRQLEAASEAARTLLGRFWQNGEAEWAQLEEIRGWARRFRSSALGAAGGDFQKAAELRESWTRLATEGRELLHPAGAIGRPLTELRSRQQSFREALLAIETLLELDAALAWGSSETPDFLGRALETVRTWKRSLGGLRSWCMWRQARAEAAGAGLAALAEAYEQGRLQGAELPAAFERSFYEEWLSSVTDPEPVLRGFFSPEHERKIQQFREVDERYTHLTRAVVAARLAERTPASSAPAMLGSERFHLSRELAKKTRHIPLRSLFQRIPNLLPRLKPCLLMSPMSVAQYLDAGFPAFDLVVFDEASQIPVWDAVGALARGRQAVIVGDPKQLPPTTFFQRSEAEAEAEDETETLQDLESILDDCLGSGIPSRKLEWHYRSRHESLIAFSNHHYYDGALMTFPSPETLGMGVSWRPVPEGVYDKGKSRTNRAEAEAVLGEIVKRIKHPGLSRLSLGVVTFSQAQQGLVEDLIETARRDDAELDALFAEDTAEPLFVKNLENVQGDERDVILFSIGYGPDARGVVSMNFGPMNREGGERRLNVAITRARREVLVFSTLRAEQIDLRRTRAQGVAHLRNFLEYAERGASALTAGGQPRQEAPQDSPFELAVRARLAERGWAADTQVGCSDYRIDLAVVDPEAPGRYLLGIECDGANYHRAKTARDRDRLREAVLRDLGWRTHRIWSADWWREPEREMQKLEAALEQARDEQRRRDEQRMEAELAEPEPLPEAASDVPCSEPLPPAEPVPAAQRARIAALATVALPAPQAAHPVYSPLPAEPARGTAQDFHGQRAARAIRQAIVEVVRQEGPIRFEAAARRIAALWRLGRMSSRVTERIESLIPADSVAVHHGPEGKFLWPAEQAPEDYALFRVPGPDPESSRPVEDLPLEEIGNAALYLLRQELGAPLDELARQTSRLFGFQRTSRQIQLRMRLGIERMVALGRARLGEAEMVSLVQGP